MSKIAKALTAALTAGAAAVATAYADGAITSNEWFGVVGAVILAGFATYQVRNAPSPSAASFDDGGK